MSKFKQYNDVNLLVEEAEFLEELEVMLGESITHIKKLRPFNFGFYCDNYQITHLSISNKQLTSLPESITNLTQLEVLFLDINRLKSLTEFIDKLTNLKLLSLNFNKLITLPQSVGNLSRLEALSLNNNQISKLPSSFGNLSRLKTLSLYTNKLSDLPSSFGNLSNLKYLVIHDNQISKLPSSFGNLSRLKELYLYQNQLTILPSSFGDLSQLNELHLHQNQLTTLPSSFGNLSRLKTLSLYTNQLSDLPSSFGDLSQLIELRLHKNQLTTLPPSFGNLSQLKELYLHENELITIPPSFGNLSQLKKLLLNNNQLSDLPSSFGNLSQLKTLLLNNNQLSDLPSSFGNLSRLKELYLHENKLSDLPDSFKNLNSLEKLILSLNEFETFDKDIWLMFSRLNSLDLTNNQFDTKLFKQVWRSLSKEREEDEKLRTFLDTIIDSIFQEDQTQELAILFEPEAELTRLATKSTHANILGVGTSISRAFYGTLIGSGLLKFYNTILMNTLNILLFLILLSILFCIFILLERFAKKQEDNLVNQRNNFIKRAKEKLNYDVDSYELILKKRYYILESEMIASRHNLWIGFTSNVLIVSCTTLWFTLFSTTQENNSTADWIISTSEWILIITVVLISFSIIQLFNLFYKQMPKLKHKGLIELNQVVSEYDNLRQLKLQSQEIDDDEPYDDYHYFKVDREIGVKCENCDTSQEMVLEYVEPVEKDEREMGPEVTHKIEGFINCIMCKQELSVEYDLYEYPHLVFNSFELHEAIGCEIEREPEF